MLEGSRWVWAVLVLLALLALPPAATVLLGEGPWSNLRNIQWVLLGVVGLLWLGRPRRGDWARQVLATITSAQLSRRSLWVLGMGALGTLLLHALFELWAFEINGIDFSIFDWMAWQGPGGSKPWWSPICDCNHFAVHQSWVLLLFVPLQALFASPYVLLLAHPVAVFLGTWPLWHLARRHLGSDGLALLTVVAYLTGGWVGGVLNYDFHIEVFYLPAGLWLAYGCEARRPWMVAVAALVWLGTKEDGAFYLMALAAGLAWGEPSRWRWSLGLASASLLTVGLNFGWVQPAIQVAGTGSAATYAGFWQHYGNSWGEVIATMVSEPWRVVRDVAASRVWLFLGSFAFLPLFAAGPAFALVPGMLLLGTASTPMMTGYKVYYPAPLVAFAFWGLLVVARRLLSSAMLGGRHQHRGQALMVGVLLLCPMVSGGYLRWREPQRETLRAVQEVRRFLDRGEHLGLVCAQTSLFPHLGYRPSLRPISKQCLETKNALGFVHTGDGSIPYPHSLSVLQQWANAGTPLVVDSASGIALFKPAR